MFDIGFPELLMLSIVCVLVLGPQRIPEVLKFSMKILRKTRRALNEVKSGLEGEVGLDEIKREIHNEDIMSRSNKDSK